MSAADRAEVELAHGGLIQGWEQFRRWLDEDRDALLKRESIREATQEWDRHERDDDYLELGGERLKAAQALTRHPQLTLNALEQAYLSASVTKELATERERARLAEAAQSEAERARRESERRASAQRVFLRIATALIVVAMCAAAIAMVYRLRAEGQRDVSLARALAAQAIGEHDRGDDERAALLARQAYLFDPEGAAREQIGTALQATIGAPFFSTIWRDAGAPVQPLTALALDTTGRFLATAGMNQRTIRLWDLQNPGREPLRLTCHGGPVTSVAFSPGGRYLASGGVGGGLILWHLDTLDSAFASDGEAAAGDCAKGLEREVLEPGADWGEVRAVTVAQRGDDLWVIAGGCKDQEPLCTKGLMRFWNPALGHQTPLDVAGGEVWSLAVSPVDGALAVGTCPHILPVTKYCEPSAPGMISVWDFAEWDPASPGEPRVATGHDGGVAALAFHPGDGRLASGGGDRNVRLWDFTQAPPAFEALQGHDAEVRALAFSPDGTLLTSGSQDETVRVWDMSRRTPERALAVLGGSEEWVRALAFAQSGDTELVLAATSALGTARVWRIDRAASNLQPPGMLRGHDHYVRGLAFAPDGQALVSVGEDSTVRLWGTLVAEPDDGIHRLRDDDGNDIGDDELKVTSVAYSADGAFLAAGDANGDVWVRRLAPPDADFMVVGHHDGGVTAVAFDPVSGRLASGSMGGTVRLWDPRDRVAVGEPLVIGGVDVRSLAFAPDGQMLAAAGCRIGGSGSCDFDSGVVVAWQIAPSGPSLVTGATLYRCAEGASSLQVGAIRDVPYLCDERGAASIAFAPAGPPLLATGHADGTILIWDASWLLDPETEMAPRELLGHLGEVRVVAFSPSDNDGADVLLASGSTDQTARIWDPFAARSTDGAARLGNPLPELARVIRGSQDPGPLVAIIGGRDEFVRTLAFNPRVVNPGDGRTLASAAADGTIRLSMADSARLAEQVCAKVLRNLDEEKEWRPFVGASVAYQSTCPNLPPGATSVVQP